MYNGAITLGMLIAALSWLSGCARRVTETAQNRQIIIDTVYNAERYEKTQKDTFARLVYVFRDTVKGGMGYYEKIISNYTTQYDTVYLQAKKHDEQETTKHGKQNRKIGSLITYIIELLASLLFVYVIIGLIKRKI